MVAHLTNKIVEASLARDAAKRRYERVAKYSEAENEYWEWMRLAAICARLFLKSIAIAARKIAAVPQLVQDVQPSLIQWILLASMRGRWQEL